MKKVYLIRANKTKFGGAENYLSRLSDEFQNSGINIELKNSIFPKFLPSWMRALLFNLQICLSKGKKFYFSLERVACPDIYRAGDGVHKVFMRIEDKTYLNPLNLVYLSIEKKMFTNAKKIIAISHMVKNDIINTYNIPKEKIKVIYNGIKIKPLNFDRSWKKLSLEFMLSKNETVFLYVGSGYKRKGVKEFLQILNRLNNKNFKAFIIGKEKNIDYYKNLAKNLNLSKKIYFTGPRTDVNDFYTISDIFLFPTHYEPFGNVILEAMNFKNVVITTNFCGGGEIINQEFIMKNPTDFSIISKIDDLMNTPAKLENIKEENYKTVQNFTIEKNAKKTMEIINEYLH